MGIRGTSKQEGLPASCRENEADVQRKGEGRGTERTSPQRQHCPPSILHFMPLIYTCILTIKEQKPEGSSYVQDSKKLTGSFQGLRVPWKAHPITNSQVEFDSDPGFFNQSRGSQTSILKAHREPLKAVMAPMSHCYRRKDLQDNPMIRFSLLLIEYTSMELHHFSC